MMYILAHQCDGCPLQQSRFLQKIYTSTKDTNKNSIFIDLDVLYIYYNIRHGTFLFELAYFLSEQKILEHVIDMYFLLCKCTQLNRLFNEYLNITK